MKRLLLASAALATAAYAVHAADLPYPQEAPVYTPPPPLLSWTGFYAGLNAGYGFGTSAATQTSGASTYDWASGALGFPFGSLSGYVAGNSNVNQNGFIGGGQIGYNYNVGSNFVVGVEADLQGASISGSGPHTGLAAVTDAEGITHLQAGFVDVQAGVNWMGTVRGRLGYLFTPTLLAYATGGFAYGGAFANVSTNGFHWHPGEEELEHPPNEVTPSYGQFKGTLPGYTVGGGFEWLFMPNWSLKAEALYYDLGTQSVWTNDSFVINSSAPGSIAIANVSETRVNFQGVIARLGVNYHF
jgi:outer membrane immunogenic protein